MFNPKAAAACAAFGLAAGLIGPAVAHAEPTLDPHGSHDGHDHSLLADRWGDDGVEIPALIKNLARFGAAGVKSGGYSASATEIFRAPKPSKNVKVTVINLVTPQGKTAGYTEDRARFLVESSNKWFRDQGISESDLNLQFSSLETITSPKAYACDLAVPGSQNGVIDVISVGDIRKFLATTGTSYDTALPVILVNGRAGGDSPSCTNIGGLGFVGGTGIMLNKQNSIDNDVITLSHEVGHNLGLRHAGLIEKNNKPGTVSYPNDTGSSVSFVSYGDPVSIMGAGMHLTETEKAALGLASKTTIVSTNGTYTLSPSGPSTLLFRHEGAVRVGAEFSGAVKTRWYNKSYPAGVYTRVIDQAGFRGARSPYGLDSKGIGMLTSLGNGSTGEVVIPPGAASIFPGVANISVVSSGSNSAQVYVTGVPGGGTTEPPATEDKGTPEFRNWSTFYREFTSAAKANLPAGTRVSATSRTAAKQTGGVIGIIQAQMPEFTDAGSGMESVTVAVTGQANKVIFPADPGQGSTLAVPVTAGVTVVEITGVDKAGNKTSKRIVVTVPSAANDKYKPTMNTGAFTTPLRAAVRASLPKGSTVSTSSRLAMKIDRAVSRKINIPTPKISDKGGSGVASISLAVNGETVFSANGTSSPPASLVGQTVYKGVNEIVVTAVDGAGNSMVRKFFIIFK